MSAHHVQGRLLALKSRFTDRVSGELDELQRLLEPRQLDAAGIQRAREAYQILHRIAGGAGSFGLQGLGAEARRLELALEPVASDGGFGPELSRHLERILNDDFFARLRELHHLLHQAEPEPTAEGGRREPFLPSEEPAGNDSVAPLEDDAGLSVIPQVNPTRVVLVDPDVARAGELSAQLEALGYRVHWLPSAEEIRAILANLDGEAPVAVVADVAMREALQTQGVDRSPAFHHTIYLGSEDSFEVRYALASARAGGFLLRPVDVSQLVERIEAQIAEYQASRRGRVLIVDDDRQRVVHTQTVLASAGFDVRLVVEPRELLAQLPAFRPDLVLMETRLGDFDGASLARMIRLQAEWENLSILFRTPAPLTDEESRELATEDVLAGPLTDRTLIACVRSRCHRARQFARLITRDSLSGVLVASRIRQEVHREHAQARRHGRHTVMAIIDLDDFRQVNRDFGHPVGDTVLRTLANLLRQRLRRTDLVGRYGGEEFMVLLPDCTGEQAELVLQDVCRQFAELAFHAGAQTFRCSLSVGLAALEGFQSADAAIAAADRALDRRKRQGKDGVSLFSPEM
ncbi:diguanylate cyclase [Marinobacter bohaiensis]|uniref:diguanylate cyclase n=1 Tax=Marinobacter bohaiensis TaxID=2201898 RepID=UPI0013A6990C|nr:diguanylate cyclase [Marinobacter bohaiensis]